MAKVKKQKFSILADTSYLITLSDSGNRDSGQVALKYQDANDETIYKITKDVVLY